MITLKTLPEASKQEVFDQVARHLLTQNAKSKSDKSDVCYYRNKDGLSCAAGCLISDKEYDASFELRDWKTLIFDGCVPSNHEELIADLQHIHDLYPIDRWAFTLRLIAEDRGLNSFIVDELATEPPE